MSELEKHRPSTPQEAEKAATAFEILGEQAIGQTGEARAKSVQEMNTYLKGLTPQERKEFFEKYSEKSAGVSFSHPYGMVTRDEKGEPTEIVFHDSLEHNLEKSALFRSFDHIHIERPLDFGSANPKNKDEFSEAITKFDQFGRKALQQTGDDRAQSIREMQDYISSMTPFTREAFFDHYDLARSGRYASVPSGTLAGELDLNAPYGKVDGTRIVFDEPPIGKMFHSVFGGGNQPIYIEQEATASKAITETPGPSAAYLVKQPALDVNEFFQQRPIGDNGLTP